MDLNGGRMGEGPFSSKSIYLWTGRYVSFEMQDMVIVTGLIHHLWLAGDLTAAEVRLQLKNDELETAEKGTAQIHGTSATSFLVAGLDFEDTQ